MRSYRLSPLVSPLCLYDVECGINGMKNHLFSKPVVGSILELNDPNMWFGMVKSEERCRGSGKCERKHFFGVTFKKLFQEDEMDYY